MMNQLSPIELDVAKEVINIGLSKAADSLSFFTKEKVIISNSSLTIKLAGKDDVLSQKKGKNLAVLTTAILGDMKGVCYLIFNEQEVEKLIRVSLPPEVLEDQSQKQMMAEAILKEADNIISASVITQFSDLLSIHMYGGVPILNHMRDDQLTAFMISSDSEGDFLLQISAKFHTEDADLKPDFIWFLDNKFIEGIKQFVKDDPQLEKLKKYSSE